eukprot:1190879-Prorocentrum_minimum.AAC.3
MHSCATMHAVVPCRVHAVRARQSQLCRELRTSHYIPKPSFGCAIRSVGTGRKSAPVMALGGESDDAQRRREVAAQRIANERGNQAAGDELKPGKVRAVNRL